MTSTCAVKLEYPLSILALTDFQKGAYSNLTAHVLVISPVPTGDLFCPRFPIQSWDNWGTCLKCASRVNRIKLC